MKNLKHGNSFDFRKLFKITLSVVLTIAICWPLLANVDILQIITVIRSVSVIALFFMIVFYGTFQLFRGERFYLIMNPIGNRLKFYATMCLQTIFNYILPAGLGEVGLVIFLKKYHKISYLRGTSLLLLARLIDITLFCFFLFFALYLVRNSIYPYALQGLLWVNSIILLVLASIWLFIKKCFDGNKYFSKNAWINKFLDKITIKPEVLKRTTFITLVAYSFTMWAAMYGFLCAVVWGLHYSLGMREILFLYLASFPISFLPIKGVANFGTHEATWVASLLAIGWNYNQAVVIAFSSHMIFIFIELFLYGLAGVLFFYIGSLPAYERLTQKK